MLNGNLRIDSSEIFVPCGGNRNRRIGICPKIFELNSFVEFDFIFKVATFETQVRTCCQTSSKVEVPSELSNAYSLALSRI